MEAAISTPNKEVSEFAPVILTIHINKDKIRDLIGPGGKTIKELVATYGAKVNTDDDGKVTVAAPNMEVGQQVVERIEEITASIEVDKIYNGKITRIEEYGVFVELIPGSTGLLHISEISNKRIKSIKDMNYKLGEKLEVKVIGVDRDNKIKISRKELENS
jgi:polyribonucleotide nucleotidyltransferase